MTKDLEFEAAVEKGQAMLRMLDSDGQIEEQCVVTSGGQDQSIFDKPEDLPRHGYVRRMPSRKFPIRKLREILRDLGANDQMEEDGGEFVAIEHIHEEDCVFDGEEATGAYLSQVCNHLDGVLIAHANQCAPYAGILLDPPIMNYPPLHHWSDIAYLQWLVSDPNPSTSPANIKYIVRCGIQNTATCSILSKIIHRQDRDTFDLWPGMTFDINSEEGQAILGTPNGSGAAYLLAQHREQLRHKTIEKVTLFHAEDQTDTFRWPSLLFWLS
ncbi:hypothetical protein P153DRAFT_300080 [Dothidotthia symphoricarpi CBS 119687]|uniref:Uncharacterized protein n=1 Tax=Dothidotthia symphoricarpi CBS 119687 TaxID=1392245 RepID=A0A6A6A2J2_9PLEO|nr:uncharacterized protein P153DRAFT_300080 [Dothidotthia symphoricarpi CBS 119687]KAF2125415.1 hypothetical protein P153DRAFT_300080 [Dothidotthia symphoricarpi CBS 119687]